MHEVAKVQGGDAHGASCRQAMRGAPPTPDRWEFPHCFQPPKKWRNTPGERDFTSIRRDPPIGLSVRIRP